MVARLLRDRFGRPWGDRVLEEGQKLSGHWLSVVFNLLRTFLPALLFRARIKGRLPGLSGEFRWFMRQRYMTPRLADSFLGFAVRLTGGVRQRENPRQVSLLLVHAFLQDLRSAYGGRPWRLRGWRRTVHPVVLLDGVTAKNGGYALLELVNKVRNDTGLWDPLLVVSTSERVPLDGLDPDDRSVWSADLARTEGYPRWKDQLGDARRRQACDAWYLRIAVDCPPVGADGDKDRPPRIVPATPPWWTRRVVPVAVVLALVAGLAVAAVSRIERHCGVVLSGGRVAVERVEPTGGGSAECVGYSDGDGYVFQQDADLGSGGPTGAGRLVETERRIFRQNREAEDRHRGQPGRPYVTLIYFGQLSGRDTFVAQAQQLEGMAYRQRHALDARQPAEPLLRIILANAGGWMAFAGRTVDLLRPLIRDDRTIVGVLGLDQSYRPAVQAIQPLTGLGLPIISPTLSADGLDDASPLYFQVNEPNVRETEIVASYARYKGFQTARILYYEVDGDLYVQTLREATRTALTTPALPWNRTSTGPGSPRRSPRSASTPGCCSTPAAATTSSGSSASSRPSAPTCGRNNRSSVATRSAASSRTPPGARAPTAPSRWSTCPTLITSPANSSPPTTPGGHSAIGSWLTRSGSARRTPATD